MKGSAMRRCGIEATHITPPFAFIISGYFILTWVAWRGGGEGDREVGGGGEVRGVNAPLPHLRLISTGLVHGTR